LNTVSVVITDLDNTLFDWVDIWHRSFKAMLDQLVKESEIPQDTLLSEFKKIHEKHRTSEYAFSIEELPSLREKYPKEDLVKKFDSAIRAFRVARKDALRLYPTVMETLQELKDKGCLLVGYTESMSYYTDYRLEILNLIELWTSSTLPLTMNCRELSLLKRFDTIPRSAIS
jgi:phosphoglycolate phosphatase-like HAD superfamily hydrolase